MSRRKEQTTDTSGWAVVPTDAGGASGRVTTAPPPPSDAPVEGEHTTEGSDATGTSAATMSTDAVDVADEPLLDLERFTSESNPTAEPLPLAPPQEPKMANNLTEVLADLQQLDGFIAAAIADSASGLCLGMAGGSPTFNVEMAAAANTEVVKAKFRAMKSLKLDDAIEDILITLGTQYHLIRPLRARPEVFFYVSLDRRQANLGMARFGLAEAEGKLTL